MTIMHEKALEYRRFRRNCMFSPWVDPWWCLMSTLNQVLPFIWDVMWQGTCFYMCPRRPTCGPVPSGNCTILIVVLFCLRSQNTDKFDPFVSSLGVNFHVMILDLNHTKMSSHSSKHQNPPSRRNDTFSAIFFAKKISKSARYILSC